MLLSNRWETESIIHNRKHEFGLMFLLHHNPFKSTVPTAAHCLPHREQNTQQKHNTALPAQGTKQASTKSAWPTDSESVLTSGFYHPCAPLSVCVRVMVGGKVMNKNPRHDDMAAKQMLKWPNP